MFKVILNILLALLIVGIIEFYAYTTIQTATKNVSPKIRWTTIAFYILITITTWIIAVYVRKISLDSSTISSQLKAILIAVLMGIFIAKLIMTIFMAADDVRRLIASIVRFFNHSSDTVKLGGNIIPRSKFLSQFAIIIGSLVLGIFLYGTRNRYNYQVKQLKLKLPHLPSSFVGLRIVHISDIHAGSFDDSEAVEKGMDMIMEQKPDLILFTGDLVNNKASELKAYKQTLARLSAPLGIFSVLGNHDYGDYVEWESPDAKSANLQQLIKDQQEMGWKVLVNENVILQKGSDSIGLIGVENWGAKAKFPQYGDLKKALNGLTETNAPVKILMSHDPSHWDAQIRKKFPEINLTLSGHTHGMQFGVDLPWLKWSPVRLVYKQWAGLYTEGKQHLYVNRGFGFIGYRGRVGILPEITVIQLQT